MKNFKDYKEDLYKCSRCGLCQSVCPVYKATLNECAVSKGKFNMLNGVLNGDLKINKNIKKYLDLCTGCNDCMDFCPSGIDARQIFLAAKRDYHKHCKLSFIESLLSSYFLFKLALICAFGFSKIYFFFGFHHIFKLIKPVLKKCGLLGKRLLLVDSLFFNKYRFVHYRSNEVRPRAKNKVVFFEGCFNKYINSETKNAVNFLLRSTGLNVIKSGFDCCGVSFLNDGNVDAFRNLAHNNLKILGSDIDFLVTDCASCNDVLKSYQNYVNSNYISIAKDMASKTVSVLDFLENYNYKLKSTTTVKVAVHIPCHENHDIEKFVKNIIGVDYIEAVEYNKCCGFSGSFALKNQDVSRKISYSKAQNYINSGADFVLTTCPACILGLEQGFIETGLNKYPTVMSLYVFLAKYCQIID